MTKNINYFKNIQSLEQLKKEYRTLAKQYHPDISQDPQATEIMKDINIQYDQLFKELQSSSTKWQEKNEDVNTYKDIINDLLKYDNINIDIVGTWLYVYGNGTYAIKKHIQSLDFKWSPKHKKYYYFDGINDKKSKKFTRTKLTYDDISNKHGRKTVTQAQDTSTRPQLAQ